MKNPRKLLPVIPKLKVVEILKKPLLKATIGQNDDLPLSYWKQKQPIETLLQKASATMVDSSIHRKIQELLIENDFPTLAEYLETAEATTKHEARFLAHMSIVLQQLRKTVFNS